MIAIINFILSVIYAMIYSVKNNNTIINIAFSFFIIVYLLMKIFSKSIFTFSKKKTIVGVVVSILLTLFTFESFNFNYKSEQIKIKNLGNSPITIEGIYLDERLIKTNEKYDKNYDIINDASLKTEYQLYNKTDKSYKMTLYPKQTYKINIKKNKKVRIDFQRGTEIANILLNNKKYTIVPYKYSDNFKANMIYDSSYKYLYNNTKQNFSLISVVLTFLLIIIYYSLTVSVLGEKKKVLYLLLLLIIGVNPIINITNFTKTVILFLFSGLMSIKELKPLKLKKRHILILIIGSLYISFSFVGDRIINESISLKLIVTYTLLSFFVFCLFPYLLSFIDFFKNRNKGLKVNNKVTYHRIIIFCITLSIGLLYQFIFSPYISHADFTMEFINVLSNTYSDWHPYFHIVILNLFYYTFGNVLYFITFRLIIYALLLNFIVFYFYKRGLSLKKIYIGSTLFTLFPVTGVMLVTLVKDIDFSIALITLSFYLFLIIDDYEYLKKYKFHYVWLTLSLILTALLRHNGIYIYIITIIFLFVISFRSKRVQLLGVMTISIISVYIIKVPLYEYLNVEAGPKNVDISTMIHGLAYLVVNEKDIDKTTESYLTQHVFSEKDFIRGYDKYNIDLLLHYTKGGFRDIDINKSKIISMYLKQITKTPVSLLQDRLYGTDMMWNVSEKDGVRMYKYQILYDEFQTNYNLLMSLQNNYKEPLASWINSILIYIGTHELWNILFFRAGIYLDLFVIFICYCIIKKKKTGLFLLAPVVNIITYLLVMAHQEYRYVWVFEIFAILGWLILIYNKKRK